MIKKVLITGGAGFIGSNFIRLILKKYPTYKIINIDKITYAGNLDNLRDIKNNPNYKFVRADICDYRKVKREAKNCEVIVNFAAETHVDRSIIKAEDFIKTNVCGTHNLLEIARESKIKRFIQIGTDEVYGSRIGGRFKENDNLNPSSPYAASKAAADLLALSYFTTYKLPIVIVRSSNNFGPYQYPEKVIPLFITNLLKNKKIPLYAQGLNVRDWLYVEDNCRAIDLILRKGKIGEIYNVAGYNYLSNIQLTRRILNKLHKPEKFIKHVKDRPGHDFRYAIDCSKVIRLGWQPKYNFNKALDLTIDWYKNNKTWWKKLI